MPLSLQEIKDHDQWNRFLLDQPTQAGIFLQSWEWLAFQESLGRKVWRLGASAHGRLTATCGLIRYPEPLGKCYLSAPRIHQVELQEALIQIAVKERAIFCRFEPVLKPHIQSLKPVPAVQPKETLIADLSGDDDARLAAMHEKTRYNIRLAERKGVRCQVSRLRPAECGTADGQAGVSGEQGGFGEFWALLEETARRDKFHTHPRSYYEKMMEMLGGGGDMHVRLWLARHEGKAIAGAIVGYFGDTATYLHGASSHEHRNLMAPYALHWEIMRDARVNGFKKYDFWGIDEKKWPGVTRFKKGFGGEVVEYPGAFDLPISRFWYTLYRLGKRVR